MQTKKNKLSGYADLIHKATSAPHGILKILERIMREEIFHSTLDWQTKEQLEDAARQAYRTYQQNPNYYDWENAVHAARWQRTQAENALKQADANDDPQAKEQARRRFELAQESYETAYQTMQLFA